MTTQRREGGSEGSLPSKPDTQAGSPQIQLRMPLSSPPIFHLPVQGLITSAASLRFKVCTTLPLEVEHPTVTLWLIIYVPFLPGEIRSSEPRRKRCVLHTQVPSVSAWHAY